MKFCHQLYFVLIKLLLSFTFLFQNEEIQTGQLIAPAVTPPEPSQLYNVKRDLLVCCTALNPTAAPQPLVLKPPPHREPLQLPFHHLHIPLLLCSLQIAIFSLSMFYPPIFCKKKKYILLWLIDINSKKIIEIGV